jgi:hypothetical protein
MNVFLPQDRKKLNLEIIHLSLSWSPDCSLRFCTIRLRGMVLIYGTVNVVTSRRKISEVLVLQPAECIASYMFDDVTLRTIRQTPSVHK